MLSKKINYCCKLADVIVRELLQHIRSSSGAKEPTNINTLADGTLSVGFSWPAGKGKIINATMNGF